MYIRNSAKVIILKTEMLPSAGNSNHGPPEKAAQIINNLLQMMKIPRRAAGSEASPWSGSVNQLEMER